MDMIIQASYLIAAVLFILGLKQMSSPVTARRGILWAGAGMVLAAGAGSLLFLESPIPWHGGGWSADLDCLTVAVAVGVLPAVGIVAFAGRAAPFRPFVLVVAAAASAAALGTVAAQASCPMADLRHLLVGHVLAPAAGALVLSTPLLVVLRRIGRSS